MIEAILSNLPITWTILNESFILWAKNIKYYIIALPIKMTKEACSTPKIDMKTNMKGLSLLKNMDT